MTPSWSILVSPRCKERSLSCVNSNSAIIMDPLVFIRLPAKFRYYRFTHSLNASAMHYAPSLLIELDCRFNPRSLVDWASKSANGLAPASVI